MMQTRVMIIDEGVKERAAAVMQYAHRYPCDIGQLHWQIEHPEDCPGNNPLRVLHILNGYRAVFTIEQQPDGWMRHVSVSVPEKGKLPNFFAVNEVLALFGFKRRVPNDKLAIYVQQGTLDCVNVLELMEPQPA